MKNLETKNLSPEEIENYEADELFAKEFDIIKDRQDRILNLEDDEQSLLLSK